MILLAKKRLRQSNFEIQNQKNNSQFETKKNIDFVKIFAVFVKHLWYKCLFWVDVKSGFKIQ